MKEIGIKNPNADLKNLGFTKLQDVFWNLSSEELVQHSLDQDQGVLSDAGALVIKTGKFTGRSPKDRFVVKDDLTQDTVDWGSVNKPFDADKFDALYNKVVAHLEEKNLYVKDVKACADPNYALKVRLVAEYPWSAQFAHNMFLRHTEDEIKTFQPDWTILCAPSFKAVAEVDGTDSFNFAILNFSKKQIIIGGTGYTGEIKKGIFSVLNYLLPMEKNVLSMHCSSNVGPNGDTAVFFGLSGTGKTTLSADPHRELIGDDEHGWSEEGVFNFEGGCYAKTINLSEEKEPDIYRAIRPGAILENIVFKEGTNEPDYEDSSITQNTRVSYPIYHIDNHQKDSRGPIPKNIFFLTADAFGVLPPLSKLTPGQAMYHFMSGYTAKVAGTEVGIVEPTATFSACFGAPFLPLHPTKYAEMLGEKMKKFDVNVWLVNTGWTGGPYGIGSRIRLKYTRQMITEVLNGNMTDVEYQNMPIFNLSIPTSCNDVPSEILNPINTWDDKEAYNDKAQYLAQLFVENFGNFESYANEEIMNGAPKMEEMVG